MGIFMNTKTMKIYMKKQNSFLRQEKSKTLNANPKNYRKNIILKMFLTILRDY